jgi:hypothetical protein
LNPPRAHGTRPSNASFETKHHPPAAFPGSLSFTEGRRTNVILREKSRKLLLCWQPRRLRWESGQLRLGKGRRHACLYSRSVLGEKLVLAASVLDGQRNLGFLKARLA